jgi:hypothetical protein
MKSHAGLSADAVEAISKRLTSQDCIDERMRFAKA